MVTRKTVYTYLEETWLFSKNFWSAVGWIQGCETQEYTGPTVLAYWIQEQVKRSYVRLTPSMQECLNIQNPIQVLHPIKRLNEDTHFSMCCIWESMLSILTINFPKSSHVLWRIQSILVFLLPLRYGAHSPHALAVLLLPKPSFSVSMRLPGYLRSDLLLFTPSNTVIHSLVTTTYPRILPYLPETMYLSAQRTMQTGYTQLFKFTRAKIRFLTSPSSLSLCLEPSVYFAE